MELDERPRTGRPISAVPPSRGLISSSRPITQQGLMGVRPIQTGNAGLNRMYKDKRYYISLMHQHVNTIREELANLRRSTADNRATALNRLEARKAAEAAARHYSECQEELSVYNVVLEVQASQEKSDKLAYETTLLRERNKHVLNELDILVSQKVHREEKIAALKKDIAEEDQVVQNLIESFSNEDKIKYIEAVNENQKSLQQIKDMQQEINRYKEAVKQYQKSLAQNQAKQEHFALLQNLDRAKVQRQELLTQLQETLTPAQQRELLVQQVKDDKVDTDALVNVKASLEQELQTKREKLAELESELNEKNSARLKKHKELRDREEHMSKFISTFGEKAPVIRDKIESLQQQILLALDHITDLVVDVNFEELDNIQSSLNQSSVDGLSNQYALLSSRLARLKSFKEKYKTELENFKTKRVSLQTEIQNLKNPEKVKNELNAKLDISKEKIESLQQNLTTTTAAVTEAERRQSEIESKLSGNELYHQIRDLEKQLEQTEKENQEMQSVLEAASSSGRVTNKLKEIEEMVSQRNEKLIYALRNKKTKTLDNEEEHELLWQDDRKTASSESKSRSNSASWKNEDAKSYHVKKPNAKTEILEFDTESTVHI